MHKKQEFIEKESVNNPVIIAENISFTYETIWKKKTERKIKGTLNNAIKQDLVIHDINLSLYKGETVALMGNNGAGKTTLGKLITGILKPQSGSVFILGQKSEELSLPEIGRKIGYAFQNPMSQLFASTVEEEIGFGMEYSGIKKEEVKAVTDKLIDLMELESVRNDYPLNLSYGEKKRVVLAAILSMDPEYLILDEPTIGLDSRRIEMLNSVLESLRSKGIGMLLISHNREFLNQNANRFLTMGEGRILDDERRENLSF